MNDTQDSVSPPLGQQNNVSESIPDVLDINSNNDVPNPAVILEETASDRSHRVSLSKSDRLALLRFFIQARTLYLDPFLAKSEFWAALNTRISQHIGLPFKSSMYTVKRLVRRHRVQLSLQKRSSSNELVDQIENTVETGTVGTRLETLVGEALKIIEEEKRLRRAMTTRRKEVQQEHDESRIKALRQVSIPESAAENIEQSLLSSLPVENSISTTADQQDHNSVGQLVGMVTTLTEMVMNQSMDIKLLLEKISVLESRINSESGRSS